MLVIRLVETNLSEVYKNVMMEICSIMMAALQLVKFNNAIKVVYVMDGIILLLMDHALPYVGTILFEEYKNVTAKVHSRWRFVV